MIRESELETGAATARRLDFAPSMSYRKAERIAQQLRERILSGEMPPGAKLPSYDELREQFGISRPTVARLLDTLRQEGLVSERGGRAVYVAQRLPHHHRYFWVTSEHPGSPQWTRFLATFLRLIERGQTGLPGQVEALVGVDGRSNNAAYQRLRGVLKQESAAGLLLVNSATMFQLPVLEAESRVPRVAVAAALPHCALVELAHDAFLERAGARLAEVGGRIAVLSPHEQSLRAVERCLGVKGVDAERLRTYHVGVLGCERVTELLFERADRPDAVFVTDDNLLEPVLLGLARARLSPSSVHVLSHCNWPYPLADSPDVEYLGFDVREIFAAARAYFCADAREALPHPLASVPPRFEHELLEPARWEAAAGAR